MRIGYWACVLSLLVAPTGCGDSPATGPPAPEPTHPVQALVIGLVTDPEGAPVPEAVVRISETCVSASASGCPVEPTSYIANHEGEFFAPFERNREGIQTLRMELTVIPPVGKGYTLGKATVEAIVRFQPPPVSDPTHVHVVLPPNAVDSRQPFRALPGYEGRSHLRADAERFYLSDPGGGASAIDPATGDWLWLNGGFVPNEGIGPQYALFGDRVVIAGPLIPTPSLAGLFLVKASDGSLMWIREAAPHQTLAVSPPDGLYASEFGIVMAFDPQTGGTRWTRELKGDGPADLAASASLVCSEILAFVECWKPATGERVWSRAAEPGSWLAIAGDVVLQGSQTGWTAMDARTGATVWEAPIGSGPPPIFFPDEARAIACADSACFEIRTDDGGLVWRTTLGGAVSGPAVEGGTLYVRVGEGSGSSIHVLDAGTGAILERILPDPFYHGFCGDPAVTAEYLGILGCGSFYVFDRNG
jgi:outer membrane protein assembly factor BamB